VNSLWAVFGALASGLLVFVVDWLRAREDRGAGAAVEAGRAAQAVVESQAAMAQAVAQAPTTQSGVIDRLEAGRF